MNVLSLIGFGALGVAALGALYWWIEIGSARMHMRQAVREVMAAESWRRDWPRRVPYPPAPLAHAWDRQQVTQTVTQREAPQKGRVV